MFKDPERRRAYFREYMRAYRAGAGRTSQDVVKPSPALETQPLTDQIDLTRPYTIEGRFPYRAWLVQGGNWYDPQTGRFVKPAPR